MINILLDTRCYIITFVIIEAAMQLSPVLSLPVWWEGGGCDVIFNITEGGLELIFLFWRGGTV